MNLQQIKDYTPLQKERNRKAALKAIGGESSNIKTFAILTAQNPNSQQESSSFNKKVNKSLIRTIKESGYIAYPIKGHFSGNDEQSYIIINIPFNVAKRYAGLYNQTSFCFGINGIVEYWEKENDEEPYNSVSNPYVKKDEVSGYNRLSSDAENYSLIGKKFKFTFPFSIFDSVSNKIQDNINKYFKGDSSVVDWCLQHVGYPVYLRMQKLYNVE